jgi:hypothetical protein
MDEKNPPQQGTIQIPVGTWPWLVAALGGIAFMLWVKMWELETKLQDSKDKNIEVLIKTNEFSVKNNEQSERNREQSNKTLEITNENTILKDSIYNLNRRLRVRGSQ